MEDLIDDINRDLRDRGRSAQHASRGLSVIKAHAVRIKARQFGAQQWREFQRRAPGRAT